jgi:hypothetical protein
MSILPVMSAHLTGLTCFAACVAFGHFLLLMKEAGYLLKAIACEFELIKIRLYANASENRNPGE